MYINITYPKKEVIFILLWVFIAYIALRELVSSHTFAPQSNIWTMITLNNTNLIGEGGGERALRSECFEA